MSETHNGAVCMTEILESISADELCKVKRLNGIDKASMKLAEKMLSQKGFKYADCLEESFPSPAKFRTFHDWAVEYEESCSWNFGNHGMGIIEFACDLLNMILGPSNEFLYWEDRVNQRAWVSYLLSNKHNPITERALDACFVGVLRPKDMMKIFSPPLYTPKEIWEKLMEI